MMPNHSALLLVTLLPKVGFIWQDEHAGSARVLRSERRDALVKKALISLPEVTIWQRSEVHVAIVTVRDVYQL